MKIYKMHKNNEMCTGSVGHFSRRKRDNCQQTYSGDCTVDNRDLRRVLFFCLFAMLLNWILFISPDAMGQEPLRISASASVSARIMTRDQIAEIGRPDTFFIPRRMDDLRRSVDTTQLAGQFYAVTLNCE